MYIDLLRGTAVEVSSLETTARRLPEADLYFWLGVMAVFDNAEDSEYYHITLLEHATPTGTAFTTHLNPMYDDPTTITTTPSSPNPKSVPATSLSVNFVERGCSSDFEKTTPQPSPIPVTTPLAPEGREYENTQLQVRRMPTEDAGRIPQEYEEMPPGCHLDARMPRCQDSGIDV